MLVGRVRQVLGVLAGFLSLVTSTILWRNVSTFQDIWPLPGLYFIEFTILPAIATYLAFKDTWIAGQIVWTITGLIASFIILGSMTVGLAYLPVFLLLFLEAILSRHEHAFHYLQGVFLAVLGGLAQTWIIFRLIKILHG